MQNSLHSSKQGKWIEREDVAHLGPDALQDRIGLLCNLGIQLTQRYHRHHKIVLWILVNVVPRAASAMSIALKMLSHLA